MSALKELQALAECFSQEEEIVIFCSESELDRLTSQLTESENKANFENDKITIASNLAIQSVVVNGRTLHFSTKEKLIELLNNQ